MSYGVNPRTGKPGPAPKVAHDGDKVQARQRVNVEVKRGWRPHPNTLPCTDCGHIWIVGERRHEYDHHKGYAAEHHTDVEPVCSTCHHARDDARVGKPECIRGHGFTSENTGRKSNGTRFCRECHRIFDRTRGARRWQQTLAKRSA